MYCPNCQVKYGPGVHTCSACDIPLVAELPPEPSPPAPGTALVTVWETYDLFALSFAKSLLQGAGIPFLSPNENFMRMFGHTSPLLGISPALGGYLLQVANEDAETARELLSDVEERRYFDDDQESAE